MEIRTWRGVSESLDSTDGDANDIDQIGVARKADPAYQHTADLISFCVQCGGCLTRNVVDASLVKPSVDRG